MSDSEGYSAFLAEKIHVLRQLKPFTYIDDVALDKILDRAWKKFSENDKKYYIEKIFGVTSLAKEKMAAKQLPTKGQLDPRAIYLKEMRLIVLQDLDFVRNHFNGMSKILENGWEALSNEQRLVYYEKMVQLSLSAPKVTLTMNWRNMPTRKIEALSWSKFHWEKHSFKCFTNETDSLAFCRFAITMQAACALAIDPTDMWKRWVYTLSAQEQEEYYEGVPQLYSLINAYKTFMEEKATIKPGYEGYFDEYSQLGQAWNDICEEARSYYTNIAYQKYLKYMENPENRFIRRYNDPKCVSNAIAIDDVNSQLTPIYPFSDHPTAAYVVYVEKKRPEYVQDSENAKKRFWAVNIELLGQWYQENDEEKQKYRDICDRFLEIKSKLNEWQITAKDVYTQELKEKHGNQYYWISQKEWDNVDAKKKKSCAEIAVENRNVFLKKYPDFYDFYTWTHCDDVVTVDSSEVTSAESPAPSTPKSAADQELEEAIEQQLDNTISDKEKALRNDPLTLGDTVDYEAFEEYACKIRAISPKPLSSNVLWRRFMLLSDEERDSYYTKALKKQVLPQALKLFAKDKCTIKKTKENEDEYAELMELLQKKWEKLSAPSKQYYLDIAEQKLLQRQKLCPEDRNFMSNMTLNPNTMEASNEPYARLNCKYLCEIVENEAYNHHKARMIYMRKELPQIMKEPEMANKRYFQLKLILGLRFEKLSDEERKPYYDLVQRVMDIHSHTKEYPVIRDAIVRKKFGIKGLLRLLSEKDQAVCHKELKQNKLKLLEEFPDVDEHFQWTIYRKQPKIFKTLAASKITQSVKNNKTSVVDETDYVDVEKQDVEDVTETTESVTNDKILENAVEENHYDAPSKASEVPKVFGEEKDVEVNADESVESNFEMVTNVETPETKETSEDSEGSSDNWEVVDGKNDSEETASSNCDDVETNDAASETHQAHEVAVE